MRARTWPERRLRRLQIEFIRSKLALLIGLVAAFCGLGALEWLVLRRSNTIRAFLLGAIVVGALWATTTVVSLFSGSMHVRFGKWGEDATRDELRKLRKAGWTVTQGINLTHGDIDFVLVGPGGVVALEAKWMDAPSRRRDMARQQLREYAARATDNARSLRLMLKSMGAPADVQPVIALWGIGSRDVLPRELDSSLGVPTMHGSDVVPWLRDLSASVPAAQQVLVRDKLRERIAYQASA